MDELNHLTSKLTLHEETNLNFTLDRISKFKPAAPRPDPESIARHKLTVLHSMAQHLTRDNISQVINGYRRSEITEELILNDFFNGDVPPHRIPKDRHYYAALEYTRRSFAPPTPARPAHLLSVEHHYPLKTKSNAEAPFSTEKTFLDQLNSPDYR
jgi:hypothetical protein